MSGFHETRASFARNADAQGPVNAAPIVSQRTTSAFSRNTDMALGVLERLEMIAARVLPQPPADPRDGRVDEVSRDRYTLAEIADRQERVLHRIRAVLDQIEEQI